MVDAPCLSCCLRELCPENLHCFVLKILKIVRFQNKNHLLNIRRSTRESQIKISFLTTKRPVALRNNLGKEN